MAVPAAELGPSGYALGQVERWRGEMLSRREDCLAEETPVALVYNGEPHVVMLATPLDLEDFALGFSLTEGIAGRREDIEAIRVYQRSEGIEVRLRLPEGHCGTVRERNLTGRTGCGLCGTRTLREAMRRPPPVGEGVRVPAAELVRAVGDLHDCQRLNRLTGAVHAAAWVVPGQGIVRVREDVGRHNALDKLIGALARQGADFGGGFVLVTSRASYEMVQKCAAVGIALLAAISAPTALAVRLAEDTGLTLVGFARGDGHTVYTHSRRLLHASGQDA